MIPWLRKRFNDGFRDPSHARFLALLEERTGIPPLFRHNETPVFLPVSLAEEMARAGREMVLSLLDTPGYLDAARARIPAPYRTPDEATRPLFVQADFGLVRDASGAWAPRLVEIQGFPSLYAYQPVLAECYRDAYPWLAEWPTLPGGQTREDYFRRLQQAICGQHDPLEVVLLEIDPDSQKTRADFVLTERECGVTTVDIRAVCKRGSRLYYQREGREVPIRRIYNRVIVDELERRGEQIPFNWNQPLDVEWAGHPNWFFLLSKFSLPWMRHPCVPETHFLDAAPAIDNLDDWVLKPLYSFAGLGVVVGPSAEELAAVPAEHRHNYILQRRMRFQPSV
ncbi:MAG: hypothetical protein MUF01_18985, partial [Bryobacterales bacterium]|nr:hypothetical protein [Bryobacterales bacterium]